MNKIPRISMLSVALAAALSLAAVAANAAAPAADKSSASAVAGPPGKAKAAKAPTGPVVRQSPYARAVHENAEAENAAIAQMQASGQPLPPHVARPAAQLSPASKGGRGHGSHR